MVMEPEALPSLRPPDAGSMRKNRDRVRKRASNACNRCRQQKIKCSGTFPCAHCTKRRLPCQFDEKQQKVLVTRGWLSDLQRQASQGGQSASAVSHEHANNEKAPDEEDHPMPERSNERATPVAASHLDIDQSESDHDDSGAVSAQEDPEVTNPLLGSASYYSSDRGPSLWLGNSSNWSFGRRVLTLLHSKAYGDAPLPHEILHFDGSSYDLGWDGRRTTSDSEEQPALPTTDFALFLINAVKFHCGQLFHLFDESVFMHHFTKFHDTAPGRANCPELWYVHYLLVLAIGKALLGRTGKGKHAAGADLFVQAMKRLPDMTYLWTDPLQAVEVLCCVALYLECLDLRIAAYNYIGQAVRIAITYGWHTDIPHHQYSEAMLERCRETFWTTYVLDCHITALQGAPTSLHEEDLSAQLPSFSGSYHKSQALSMNVKLAKITAFIQQTVYRRHKGAGGKFLKSMKTALKALADINDERTTNFPLQLDDSSNSISRLSAHLHLFHHQAIILTTKPLLFSFLQKRLEASKPVRISSTGGLRALMRVSVGSARQIMKILAALQTQALLESFIPFDLESVWCAALVLLIARFVDPSLFKGHGPDHDASSQIANSVLDDMSARGNLVAGWRRAELEQIAMTIQQLQAPHFESSPEANRATSEQLGWDAMTQPGSTTSQNDFIPLQDWTFEDVLSGQQLEAVADSLNSNNMDWLSDLGPLDQLDNSFL